MLLLFLFYYLFLLFFSGPGGPVLGKGGVLWETLSSTLSLALSRPNGSAIHLFLFRLVLSFLFSFSPLSPPYIIYSLFLQFYYLQYNYYSQYDYIIIYSLITLLFTVFTIKSYYFKSNIVSYIINYAISPFSKFHLKPRPQQKIYTHIIFFY